MAIDAVCLTAIVAELGPQLTGLRVDKVQQPARDQVRSEERRVGKECRL